MDTLVLVALPIPPPEPGFELLISSHGMSQGVAQTDGWQLIPRAYLRIGEVQADAQWRNISSPSANGVAAFFLKLNHTVGKGQVDLAVAYRVRTGLRHSAVGEALEFDAGAARQFGRLGLRVNAEYSPDDFGSGQSLYVEGVSTFRIGGAARLSAAIGERWRDGGPDHTAFNAGLSRTLRQKLTLDARYYGTSRGELGERYQGRIVVSARLAL